MKELYTSPKVTIEELTKLDVLCSSTETTKSIPTGSNKKFDNANQLSRTLSDFSNFM